MTSLFLCPLQCTQLGPYDRIWLADSLVSSDLGKRLLLAVNPLEDVPDEQKDWHPGSDQQVLDLVHRCPLVYERTFGKKGDIYDVYQAPPKASSIQPECHSRIQWLPSDFVVSSDGSVKLSSPYTNNVHPIYQPELAEIIEKVISEAAIPLWEHVHLRWITQVDKTDPDCLWPGQDRYFDDEEEESGRWSRWTCLNVLVMMGTSANSTTPRSEFVLPDVHCRSSSSLPISSLPLKSRTIREESGTLKVSITTLSSCLSRQKQ